MYKRQLPTFIDSVREEIEQFGKGEPIIWSDLKPIGLLADMLKDVDVGHVFDLSVGNVSAAIACSLLGVPYDGLAATPAHQAFAEDVMDRALIAILTDTGKNKNLQQNDKAPAAPVSAATILKYFAPTAAEGRRSLTSIEGKAPVPSEAGESDDDQAARYC